MQKKQQNQIIHYLHSIESIKHYLIASFYYPEILI